MSIATPFRVTSAALETINSLLRRHQGMDVGLQLLPCLEVLDDHGAVEARLERETFWLAYDDREKHLFSEWPQVELCGQSVHIAPDALERLKGKTLTLEGFDSIFDGEKLFVIAS